MDLNRIYGKIMEKRDTYPSYFDLMAMKNLS